MNTNKALALKALIEIEERVQKVKAKLNKSEEASTEVREGLVAVLVELRKLKESR